MRMDIESKLKILIWCFIAGLWSLFMFQYINGDKYRNSLGRGKVPAYSAENVPHGVVFASVVKKQQAKEKEKERQKQLAAARASRQESEINSSMPLSAIPKAKIKSKDPYEIGYSTVSAYDYSVAVSTAFRASDMQAINVSGDLVSSDSSMSGFQMPEHSSDGMAGGQNQFEGKNSITSETRQHRVKPLEKDISPSDYPATPKGFQQKVSQHFVLYEEGEVSDAFYSKAEELHKKMMLALSYFSPWTREKKVFVFYAHSQSSYQKISGRPAWSGGAASLDARSIYLFKSKNSYGILSHELTHMYFDSFFPPEHPSPLWLSEGMAIYMQTDVANAKPSWLDDNLKRIQHAAGYKFEVLITIDDLDEADEDNIRLWYAQAYSLTKYLINLKGQRTFYSFCNFLKNGFPIEQAVRMAYSQSLETLDFNWRYSMQMSSR